MLVPLIIQTLILPAVLAVVSVYLTKKFLANANDKLASVLMLSWLVNSFYILGLPAFLPRQASDWFWIVVLIVVGLMHTRFITNKRLALCVVFIAAVLAKTWAVLTVNATFDSHGFTWLTILVFMLTGALMLKQVNDGNTSQLDTTQLDNIYYLVFVALLGFITSVSGSITIALLCLSWSAMLLMTILLRVKTNIVILTPSLLLLSLLLLLHAWQYADIGLASLVVFLAAFALLFGQLLHTKLRYLLLGGALIFLLINLALNVYWLTEQAYY